MATLLLLKWQHDYPYSRVVEEGPSPTTVGQHDTVSHHDEELLLP